MDRSRLRLTESPQLWRQNGQSKESMLLLLGILTSRLTDNWPLEKIKNLNLPKKRHLFVICWFFHKHHILLHNSFLLSYYFWKSINKWWNGGDLKLALWAMGKTEKRGTTLQCLAARKGFSRCASNFACNVHIDTRWCTRYFNVLGPFLDTERDYFWDALRITKEISIYSWYAHILKAYPISNLLMGQTSKNIMWGWNGKPQSNMTPQIKSHKIAIFCFRSNDM